MLRFIRKMLVELRMSLDLRMTRGTITLPMTPMPRMMTQNMMEVVRMYAGNTGGSKSEPLVELGEEVTGRTLLLMNKYGYVELLSGPGANEEIISEVVRSFPGLRTKL